MDNKTALIRNQSSFVKHVQEQLESILAAKGEAQSHSYAHEMYKYGAFSMALLYKLDHRDNALRGQAWLKNGAVRLIENWFDSFESAGNSFLENLCEWPWFITAQACDLLGREVDDRFRHRARQFVGAWIDQHAMSRPFGTTSPNHEAWRCLSMFYAGKVFAAPVWSERALFFARQLCTLQTPEGFWEEGRHHGPSMKYNSVMLSALAYLYRLSGDARIGEAATKLARFMATWTFPDGTTVGNFDGRQSTSLAYWSPVCPGLELTPEGVMLNQRGVELWARHGAIDQPGNSAVSNWYAHFATFQCATALRYYSELAREEGPTAPLAVDAPDARLENHSAYFDGTIRRWGKWALALSSQESDIAKEGNSKFRLERQSRLELWHKDAGVILGGGHNISGSAVPLANVHFDFHENPRVNFGEVAKPGDKSIKLMYMPRAAKSSFVDKACRLSLHFAHGTVEWTSQPLDDETFKIRAHWDVVGIARMILQIPLILWRGAEFQIDGNPEDGAKSGLSSATRLAEIRDSRMGSVLSCRFPTGGETRLRTGLEMLRTYGELCAVEHFEAPYHILLASTQFDNPTGRGQAEWELRCKKI